MNRLFLGGMNIKKRYNRPFQLQVKKRTIAILHYDPTRAQQKCLILYLFLMATNFNQALSSNIKVKWNIDLYILLLLRSSRGDA